MLPGRAQTIDRSEFCCSCAEAARDLAAFDRLFPAAPPLRLPPVFVVVHSAQLKVFPASCALRLAHAAWKAFPHLEHVAVRPKSVCAQWLHVGVLAPLPGGRSAGAGGGGGCISATADGGGCAGVDEEYDDESVVGCSDCGGSGGGGGKYESAAEDGAVGAAPHPL